MPETTKKLFRFHWDCGRQGDLEGLFVSTQAEVDAVIGKNAYFGEALGKHSEIAGPIEEGEIEMLSDDQAFVLKYEDLVGNSGFNPLEYVEEEEG